MPKELLDRNLFAANNDAILSHIQCSVHRFIDCLDDTNTLTYGDNGDGEYYFYYTPSYPWNRAENEPKSIADVHERIIAAVLRLCDISVEEIEAIIDDDIYDCGCG